MKFKNIFTEVLLFLQVYTRLYVVGLQYYHILLTTKVPLTLPHCLRDPFHLFISLTHTCYPLSWKLQFFDIYQGLFSLGIVCYLLLSFTTNKYYNPVFSLVATIFPSHKFELKRRAIKMECALLL